MRKSGSGRTVLLVILLLIGCYFADWTDNNNSYWAATRWRAFQTANGRPQTVSGGAYDDSRMFLATSRDLVNGRSPNSKAANSSVLESVFGAPLGEPSASSSSANDDGNASSMSNTNRALRGASNGRLGALGGHSGEAGAISSGLCAR